LKKGDNIEELFKDAFDRYEVDPGDQLWSKIQSEIPSAGSSAGSSMASQAAAASKAGSAWLTTAIVGGAIVVTSVAGYFYFENKAEAIKEEIQQAEKISSETEKMENELPSNKAEDVVVPPNNNEDIEEADQIAEESKMAEKVESIEETTSSAKDSDKIKSDKEKKTSTTDTRTKEQVSSEKVIAEKESNSNSTTSSNIDAQNETRSELGSEPSGNNNSTTSTPSQNIDKKEEEHNSNLDPSDPITGGTLDNEEETVELSAIEMYKPMNVFSPNGDGINDVFKIDMETIEELEIEAIEVKIFSPSTGKIIYQWNDKYGYWDGMTNSGIRATEGPYFYQMILKKDGREIPKQGTITLTK